MQYLNLMLEHWYFLTGFTIIILWAIAIFVFGRISVRHIEREMAKADSALPHWDKRMGMRLSMYAFTILRGKPIIHCLLTDKLSLNTPEKLTGIWRCF